MSHDVQYMTEQVQRKLLDSTIITSLKTEDGESFGFRVRTKDKAIFDVWVDRDAEGNGPGWLAIQSSGVT
jgi:hypothetical protein